MKRTAALGLGLALFAHVHGTWLYLRRLDTNRTLLAPAARPEVSERALAARVRVVVVDGLRDDAGEKVPELRALATRGARRILRSEWPSFTYPNLAAMVTGVPPRWSGVRTNSGRKRAPLDTISAVLVRHGRTVAVAGRTWHEFVERVAPGMTPSASGDLEWIYFGEVDGAGHAYGAASRPYAEALARAGAFVASVAAGMDLSRETLVVLADHGHRDRGGHGGREPEVTGAYFLAVGAGVRAGVRLPEAPVRDVAPTLARLLGVPAPRDSMGVPLEDLFAEVPLAVHQEPPYPLGPRRWGRLGVASLLLLALGVWSRPRVAWRDFVAWPVYAALFFAGYFALGYPLGWSIPRGFLHFFVEAGLLGVAAAAVAVWTGRKLGSPSRSLPWLWGVYLMLAAAAGLDMVWLEIPSISWAVILGSTMVLYLAAALGISALI